MSKRKIQVGDWVRFLRGGQLVIGEVRYIGKIDSIGRRHFTTDVGEIDEEDILEVRTS